MITSIFTNVCLVVLATIPVAALLLWINRPKRDQVDNDVTRAGEGLRPFVEAMKGVDKRGKELYEKCKKS